MDRTPEETGVKSGLFAIQLDHRQGQNFAQPLDERRRRPGDCRQSGGKKNAIYELTRRDLGSQIQTRNTSEKFLSPCGRSEARVVSQAREIEKISRGNALALEQRAALCGRHDNPIPKNVLKLQVGPKIEISTDGKIDPGIFKPSRKIARNVDELEPNTGRFQTKPCQKHAAEEECDVVRCGNDETVLRGCRIKAFRLEQLFYARADLVQLLSHSQRARRQSH